MHVSTACEATIFKTSIKRCRKDFVTSKLVAALDRCQTHETLCLYFSGYSGHTSGHNIEEYPINKFSIQRIRTQTRKIKIFKMIYQKS